MLPALMLGILALATLTLAALGERAGAKNLRKLSCLIKYAVIKLPSRERRGVMDF